MSPAIHGSRRRAALARNWWALVIRGVIAVLFGLAAFVAPGLVAATLVLVFGAYALVDGVFAIIAAVLALARHERWGLLLLEGVIGIAAGAAAWAFPGLAIVVFITLLAVWAVITGGLMLAAAFQLDTGHGNWMMGLGGLVSIIWGVLLWTWPIAGAVGADDLVRGLCADVWRGDDRAGLAAAGAAARGLKGQGKEARPGLCPGPAKGQWPLGTHYFPRSQWLISTGMVMCPRMKRVPAARPNPGTPSLPKAPITSRSAPASAACDRIMSMVPTSLGAITS